MGAGLLKALPGIEPGGNRYAWNYKTNAFIAFKSSEKLIFSSHRPELFI